MTGQNKGVIPIFPYSVGTVHLKVENINPETLINRLRREIPLRKITKASAKELHIEIMYRHKQTVLDTVRTFFPKAKITVVKQTGLPVITARCKKRFGLFVGAFLAAVLAFLSSQRIWVMTVEGNQSVESTQIVELLRSLGIAEGMKKKTKDLEYLYNDFLLKEKRISWIAINYDGMIAHVEVKETEKAEKQIDKRKVTNLVAACDGVIRRVDALDGSAAVSSGDTVYKGELLVSAFMETRETGTVLRTARGSVWASTIHGYAIQIPKCNMRKRYVGKQTRRTICILGEQIPLFLPVARKAETCEKSFVQEPVVLFDFVRLPLSVQTVHTAFYRPERGIITKEEAAEKAAAELVKRIESDLARAEILKREDHVKETDTAYIFTYELYCLENIAVPAELQLGISGCQAFSSRTARAQASNSPSL